MHLLNQHVVVDVANGERATLPDEGHHFAHLRPRHSAEPAAGAIAPHGANEEPDIPRGHVRQRVRPVFEDRLVDALGLMQMGTLVAGNAREEDVMMAALDHIDRVDLHVTQVLHRRAGGLGTVAEWRFGLKPLRPQPDASGASLGERVGLLGNRAHQHGSHGVHWMRRKSSATANQRLRPIAKNFSCRCRRIASAVMPANSRRALARASPVLLKMAAVSRWAPPTGSVMMTSMTPRAFRSCAVTFMLVAASIARAASRHRIEAAASGEATV